MPDKQFEISFSQMAHNQVSEQVPSLLKDVVGFQLLDKDEDETKGCGAVLAMLGKTLVAMPVFFLNGDVKTVGLYVVTQDLFLPVDDKWIGVLREKGTRVFGDSVQSPNDKNQGIPPGQVSIDLAQLAGFGKLASAETLLTKDEAHAMLTYNGIPGEFSLEKEVPNLGKMASAVFAHEFCTNTDFANALMQHYTVEDLQKLASDAVKLTVVKDNPTEKTEKVTLFTAMKDQGAENLTAREKEQLVRNGVYAKDDRKIHTTVFSPATDELRWETPTEAGWYRFRTADGKSIEGAVFQNIGGSDCCTNSLGYSGGNRGLLFNTPEGKADATMGRPSIVVEAGDKSVAYDCKIKPDTVAQRIKEKKNSGKPCTKRAIVEIAGKEHGGRAVIFDTKGHATAGYIYQSEVDGEFSLNGNRICFVETAASLQILGQLLLVPTEARILSVKEIRHSFSPCDFTDIDAMISKTAGAHSLTVVDRDGQFIMRSIHGSFDTLDKVAALSRLMMVEGLQAGIAQRLLNQATREKQASVLLKYAYPYMQGDLQNRANGPVDMDGGTSPVVTEESGIGRQEIERNKGGINAEEGQTAGNDKAKKDFLLKATNAANAGEKQVADLYMLQALLDSTDEEEVLGQLRTRTIQAMDGYGRSLFYLYWHKDEYTTKYGDTDYTRWIKTLTQAFKITGDIVYQLKLKRATVDNNDILA